MKLILILILSLPALAMSQTCSERGSYKTKEIIGQDRAKTRKQPKPSTREENKDRYDLGKSCQMTLIYDRSEILDRVHLSDECCQS